MGRSVGEAPVEDVYSLSEVRTDARRDRGRFARRAGRPGDPTSQGRRQGAATGGGARASARKAESLGFGKIRFHDLRGIHSTALLDAGIPVHTVAQRIGDDPAILLRSYVKRTRSRKADQSVAAAIADFASGFLRK